MSEDDHRKAADVYLGGVIEISKERDALKEKLDEAEHQRDVLQSKLDTTEHQRDALDAKLDEAIRERDACHQCWNDFTAKIATKIPQAKHWPLFSSADEIVKLLDERDALRAELEQAAESDAKVIHRKLETIAELNAKLAELEPVTEAEIRKYIEEPVELSAEDQAALDRAKPFLFRELKLQARIKELDEALRWYADKNNWTDAYGNHGGIPGIGPIIPAAVSNDWGQRARAALEKSKP